MIEFDKDREVCDAATEGPWEVSDSHLVETGYSVFAEQDTRLVISVPPTTHAGETDAIFIARARSRWPAALDEIERLREQAENGKRAANLYYHEQQRAKKLESNLAQTRKTMLEVAGEMRDWATSNRHGVKVLAAEVPATVLLAWANELNAGERAVGRWTCSFCGGNLAVIRLYRPERYAVWCTRCNRKHTQSAESESQDGAFDKWHKMNPEGKS